VHFIIADDIQSPYIHFLWNHIRLLVRPSFCQSVCQLIPLHGFTWNLIWNSECD